MDALEKIVYEQYSRPQLKDLQSDPYMRKVLDGQMQAENLKMFNRPFGKIALTNMEPKPLMPSIGAGLAANAPLIGGVAAGMTYPSMIGEDPQGEMDLRKKIDMQSEQLGGPNISEEELNSMLASLGQPPTKAPGMETYSAMEGDQALPKKKAQTPLTKKSPTKLKKLPPAAPKKVGANVIDIEMADGSEVSDEDAFDYGTLGDYVMDVMGKKKPKNPMQYEK